MNNRILVKSIIVLVVICLLTSAALAVVNHVTAPIIEESAKQREDASRKAVLPEADEFQPLQLEGMPDSIVSAYVGLSGDSITGYVFTAENHGFNGAIQVMAAIRPDGILAQAATIDVTSETATLGGQTAKESYTSQYAGKDASLDGVQAISGATITSKAYEHCVRDCFAAYEAVKEE